MHIYFSGIGGTGIGPLALIAKQAGYTVSGSDKQSSQYTHYLQKHGIRLHIGQTVKQIAAEHAAEPIDWLVYSSALPLEQPDHPELQFAKTHGIKTSKRDACINEILEAKDLSMLAAAGTHGKTTTTAMLIWLFKDLDIPLSYSVGAKIPFGEMGNYDKNSSYFVYECDEFDKNFLQFYPSLSIITTVDWDHHEIYPTRNDYKAAFLQFIEQSKQVILFEKDANYLGISKTNPTIRVIYDSDELISAITLAGAHNRRNARLAIEALKIVSSIPTEVILKAINEFPGSSRRFEKIADNLYSDYAHTPEEVEATIQMARELSDKVVVVYEPLTDRRQHFMKELYGAIFEPAEQVYWLPSYLAREDSNQTILSPSELIAHLSNKTKATVASKSLDLLQKIDEHLSNGSLVLCIAGGGGGSLDEWIRQAYAKKA